MKFRKYFYVQKEDITACKEMFRTIIKRWRAKGYDIDESDVKSVCYDVCKYFDCMYCDFREDFETWAMIEITKGGC